MKTQDLQLLKSTFAVAFIIQKGKCRSDGTAPIFARISLNTEKVHIVTRQYINPTHRNVVQGRTFSTTQIYARITDQKVSRYMELLSEKLNGLFNRPIEPSQKSKECVTTKRHIVHYLCAF